MYVLILNFRTGNADVLKVEGYDNSMAETQSLEDFIEQECKYKLKDCEWMTFNEKPHLIFHN